MESQACRSGTTRLAALALLATASFLPSPAGAIGGQLGFEFAIDAPWRIEPLPTDSGRTRYPAIPITIAFHDTIFEGGRGTLASQAFEKIAVGKLVGVRISEMGTNAPPVVQIPASSFAEIEVKRDLSEKTREPIHWICRPAAGQLCGDMHLNISDSHEWHGLVWYTPRTPLTPGKNLYLKVTVNTVVTRTLPFGTGNIDVPKEWTNHVVVHAGEAPLPRFANNWLYGDFHYHSQMTDNEGESAYSYRNVARALGVSGLDFVFATDHASNGEQIDGSVGSSEEARDLNARRFLAAKKILYAFDGTNQLIESEAKAIGFPRYLSASVLPQIYMGEELDAIPEISAQEYANETLYFGDLGLTGASANRYEWLRRQPRFTECLSDHGLNCKRMYAKKSAPDGSRYLLLDDQGLPVPGSLSSLNEEPRPSRQHIVYFPADSRATANGWIASDTGPFGGASKPLRQLVREIEAGGHAFLAHPVENLEPGSGFGPDVVPYSDMALFDAWKSPAILGLQFWNENDRYKVSAPGGVAVKVDKTHTPVIPIPTKETYTYHWAFGTTGAETSIPWRWQSPGNTTREVAFETVQKLYHGAATWDRFLRHGVNPQLTSPLSWLPSGEPRKWYAAAGSDSHGDWNFRRYGRPTPSLNRWTDTPVGDTAIGNPRNLVAIQRAPGQPITVSTTDGNALRYGNHDVIGAIRAGRFSVTDGPALRIAVDRNRNGNIDDTDFQMGDTFDFFPGEHIPLLVEWYSTPEFGPIDQVDIYVGNQNATYAAKSHGPGVLPITTVSGVDYHGGYARDPSGALQVKLTDDAWGRFVRTDVPQGVQYHGLAKVYLGPAQFQLALRNRTLSYLRASARTVRAGLGSINGQCPEVGTAGNKCGDRFAYSNPIWARYRSSCPLTPTRAWDPSSITILGGTMQEGAFLDSDNSGLPDTCERGIQDACANPNHPEVGSTTVQPTASTATASGNGTTGGAVGTTATTAATEEVLNPSAPFKPIPEHSCQRLQALTP